MISWHVGVRELSACDLGDCNFGYCQQLSTVVGMGMTLRLLVVLAVIFSRPK